MFRHIRKDFFNMLAYESNAILDTINMTRSYLVNDINVVETWFVGLIKDEKIRSRKKQRGRMKLYSVSFLVRERCKETQCSEYCILRKQQQKKNIEICLSVSRDEYFPPYSTIFYQFRFEQTGNRLVT